MVQRYSDGSKSSIGEIFRYDQFCDSMVIK